ncbi:unnamed protein product, partial [Mesorhabditis spiculigera]
MGDAELNFRLHKERAAGELTTGDVMKLIEKKPKVADDLGVAQSIVSRVEDFAQKPLTPLTAFSPKEAPDEKKGSSKTVNNKRPVVELDSPITKRAVPSGLKTLTDSFRSPVASAASSPAVGFESPVTRKQPLTTDERLTDAFRNTVTSAASPNFGLESPSPVVSPASHNTPPKNKKPGSVARDDVQSESKQMSSPVNTNRKVATTKSVSEISEAVNLESGPSEDNMDSKDDAEETEFFSKHLPPGFKLSFSRFAWRPGGEKWKNAQNDARLNAFEKDLEALREEGNSDWTALEDEELDFCCCDAQREYQPFTFGNVKEEAAIPLPTRPGWVLEHPKRSYQTTYKKINELCVKLLYTDLGADGEETVSFKHLAEMAMLIGGYERYKLRGLRSFWEEHGEIYQEAAKYMIRLLASAEESLNMVNMFLLLNCNLGHSHLAKGTRSVTLNLCQCATLITFGFFGAYPDRLGKDNYPRFEFDSLINSESRIHQEKLKFIFNYFQKISGEHETRCKQLITFTRRTMSPEDLPDWENSAVKLSSCNFALDNQKRIEDYHYAVHLDFANRRIGGGVLEEGAVQEEVLMLCRPDTLVSMLICEKMYALEAIQIKGAPMINSYKGYGHSLEFVELPPQECKMDELGGYDTEILAIDAHCFQISSKQYCSHWLNRELNKAFVGFYHKSDKSYDKSRPLATGKWGCGVFNGDPYYKALLQWMAAAVNHRDMVMTTFGDESLLMQLDFQIIMSHKLGLTVGQLYKILLNWEKFVEQGGLRELPLPLFIMEQMEMAYGKDLDD